MGLETLFSLQWIPTKKDHFLMDKIFWMGYQYAQFCFKKLHPLSSVLPKISINSNINNKDDKRTEDIENDFWSQGNEKKVYLTQNKKTHL